MPQFWPQPPPDADGTTPSYPIDLHATAALPTAKPELHTEPQAPAWKTSRRPEPLRLGALPSKSRAVPSFPFFERRQGGKGFKGTVEVRKERERGTQAHTS